MEGLEKAAFVMLIMALVSACQARLTSNFYGETCPEALRTIQASVESAIAREPRMAASLIRLHFHDCFVQGCDGSILLDETSSIDTEKTAAPNKNSTRGFEVIEKVKSQVEKICPAVVSCADIIAVAARDASVFAGGPSWRVKLGRKDSKTASRNLANTDLPKFTDSLQQLIFRFQTKGLSVRDMVALSGSHTLGQAQCLTFRDRIYNETNIDAGFASARHQSCPTAGGDQNLAALDLVTPNSFDNKYFKNLIQKKGLLHSDQVLFSGGSTDNIVLEYSKNRRKFYSDFASAMLKMGNLINPSPGEIRRICSVVN
ncbi:lignin-forming anionic peroxidase-like [Euphorbia lathyris]|uniref:lignin-forming anionic peroxidase-like n=1 Tax=Euphorbia lathyris TaxID=212925 RepID=UPI0033131ED0